MAEAIIIEPWQADALQNLLGFLGAVFLIFMRSLLRYVRETLMQKSGVVAAPTANECNAPTCRIGVSQEIREEIKEATAGLEKNNKDRHKETKADFVRVHERLDAFIG